jgi:hypothetical protein
LQTGQACLARIQRKPPSLVLGLVTARTTLYANDEFGDQRAAWLKQ